MSCEGQALPFLPLRSRHSAGISNFGHAPRPNPTLSECSLNHRRARSASEGPSSWAGSSLRKHLVQDLECGSRSCGLLAQARQPCGRPGARCSPPAQCTCSVLERTEGWVSTAPQTGSPSAERGPVDGAPHDRGGPTPPGEPLIAAADTWPRWPHQKPSRMVSEQGCCEQEDTVKPRPHHDPEGPADRAQASWTQAPGEGQALLTTSPQPTCCLELSRCQVNSCSSAGPRHRQAWQGWISCQKWKAKPFRFGGSQQTTSAPAQAHLTSERELRAPVLSAPPSSFQADRAAGAGPGWTGRGRRQPLPW